MTNEELLAALSVQFDGINKNFEAVNQRLDNLDTRMDRMAFFVLGLAMSSWQSVSRVTTRSTLPSTAASRRPKAAEAMALAV